MTPTTKTEKTIYALSVAFIFVLILILPFSEVATSISNNASFYLNEGWRLWNGKTPEFYRENFVARGPLYSLLVALTLGIFNQSITAVFFLSKIIYFFTLFVYSAFVKRYLSRLLAAFLLILFGLSPQLYKVGTQIDTQPLHAMLMALFVWSWVSLCKGLMKWGPEQPIPFKLKWKIFLSSLAFAIGLYNKEMTLLLIGLIPILFFIPKISIRRKASIVAAWSFLVLILFSPWLIFVYQKSLSLWPALGHMNPHFLTWFKINRLQVSSGATYATDVSMVLRSIAGVARSLSLLFPLFIIGLGYLLQYVIKTYRTSPRPQWDEKTLFHFSLLSAALTQLITPYGALVIGAAEDVLRHAFLFYFFSIAGFLCFLRWSTWPLLHTLRKRITTRLQEPRKFGSQLLWTGGIGLLLGSIGVLYLVNTGHVYAKYVLRYSPLPKIYGRMTSDQKDAAKFVSAQIPKGTLLHTDGTLAEVFDFFLSYEYPTIKGLEQKHYREGSLPFSISCARAPEDLPERSAIRQFVDVFRAFWQIDLNEFVSATASQIIKPSSIGLKGTLFIYALDEFCWPNVFDYWKNLGAVTTLYQNNTVAIVSWNRNPSRDEIVNFPIVYSENFNELVQGAKSPLDAFRTKHPSF